MSRHDALKEVCQGFIIGHGAFRSEHSVPRGGKKSNFVMPPNNSKIISVFSRGQLRVILIDFGLISILLCEF